MLKRRIWREKGGLEVGRRGRVDDDADDVKVSRV